MGAIAHTAARLFRSSPRHLEGRRLCAQAGATPTTRMFSLFLCQSCVTSACARGRSSLRTMPHFDASMNARARVCVHLCVCVCMRGRVHVRVSVRYVCLHCACACEQCRPPRPLCVRTRLLVLTTETSRTPLLYIRSTFDGVHFNFQLQGLYTLARTYTGDFAVLTLLRQCNVDAQVRTILLKRPGSISDSWPSLRTLPKEYFIFSLRVLTVSFIFSVRVLTVSFIFLLPSLHCRHTLSLCVADTESRMLSKSQTHTGRAGRRSVRAHRVQKAAHIPPAPLSFDNRSPAPSSRTSTTAVPAARSRLCTSCT